MLIALCLRHRLRRESVLDVDLLVVACLEEEEEVKERGNSRLQSAGYAVRVLVVALVLVLAVVRVVAEAVENLLRVGFGLFGCVWVGGLVG